MISASASAGHTPAGARRPAAAPVVSFTCVHAAQQLARLHAVNSPTCVSPSLPSPPADARLSLPCPHTAALAPTPPACTPCARLPRRPPQLLYQDWLSLPPSLLSVKEAVLLLQRLAYLQDRLDGDAPTAGRWHNLFLDIVYGICTNSEKQVRRR